MPVRPCRRSHSKLGTMNLRHAACSRSRIEHSIWLGAYTVVAVLLPSCESLEREGSIEEPFPGAFGQLEVDEVRQPTVEAFPENVPRWQVVKELEIGSVDDPNDALVDPRGMIVATPSGEMLVGQPQRGVVVRFGPSGEHLGTIASPGQGPGEFNALSEIGVIGDTVYAVNMSPPKISYFLLSGEHIRTDAVAVTPGEPYVPAPIHVRVDGESFGYAIPHLPALRSHEDRPQWLPYLRVNRYGVIHDTVALLPVEGRTVRIDIPGNLEPMVIRKVFNAAPVVAIAPDGRQLAVVQQGLEIDRERGVFRVTRLSYDGNIRNRTDYAYRPIRIPEAWTDSVVDANYRELQSYLRSRGARVDVAEALEMPEFFPPIEAAHISATGHLWLKAGPGERAGSASWWVYDSSGSAVGRVSLPLEYEVRAISDDVLLGSVTGTLGVPQVVRYRIQADLR